MNKIRLIVATLALSLLATLFGMQGAAQAAPLAPEFAAFSATVPASPITVAAVHATQKAVISALPSKKEVKITEQCKKERPWTLVTKRDLGNLRVRTYVAYYKDKWRTCNVAKELQASSKTHIEVSTYFSDGWVSVQNGSTKVESYYTLDVGECLAYDSRLKQGKKVKKVIYGATLCSE